MDDHVDERMLALLQRAWGLPAPARLTPLAHGTNNRMWRVETAHASFVLRVYSNHTDEARVRFEHAILVGVAAAGLPFAVPAPIATRDGALYVRVATDGGATLAVLTPFLPGAHPRREDLAQAEAAGAALGALDLALADLPSPDPSLATSWRSYGDLERCHPLVPDPLAAIRALPLAEEVRARLIEGYQSLMARVPALYASLSMHLCHEDYGPDNMLMEGARVTGVLDFEFCARDVRVMDLTVALSWWPVAQLGSGAEWPIIRAFTTGYARHITLTGAEIAAIPTLYHLRAYTSLIHRLGRYRQGLSPLEAVTDRAEAAIAREDWLRAYGARFVETVDGCMSSS
ncbi:MAG TPA: phosphotransferase [Ktedonobacterales bacterium]